MAGRGIDIDADLMGRTGYGVVPQSHGAVAENESTTVSERAVVVGDRKPGDRRSHAGEQRDADASGGGSRREPATDDTGGSTSAALGGFVPFQQHTSGDRDRKGFAVRDVVKAGVNLNRRAALRGLGHREGDGLERQARRPGIRIRAGGGVHVEDRLDRRDWRGRVLWLLFPGAGGKRKRRKNDDGNPAVRG